jgi:hypothetical protein
MRRTLTVAALTAAAAAPAAFGASHAKLWHNARGTVSCGLEQPANGKPATTLLCSAKGIPRPRGAAKGAPGDPFVQITRSGKPKLVLISQFSYETTHSEKLVNGTIWRSVGVTCKLGSTVRCSNRSGHGFKIGNGKYKPF